MLARPYSIGSATAISYKKYFSCFPYFPLCSIECIVFSWGGGVFFAMEVTKTGYVFYLIFLSSPMVKKETDGLSWTFTKGNAIQRKQAYFADSTESSLVLCNNFFFNFF